MHINETQYFSVREELVENLDYVVSVERQTMDFLLNVLVKTAPDIYRDFSAAHDLIPFWISYPPKQRGRGPTGSASPWSEVGEKSIVSNISGSIKENDVHVTFPGLPYGGDIRFATSRTLVHLDIKMTGPNDNADELVVPPQQISGDGANWNTGGFLNSYCIVQGQKAAMEFHPKLPPFYIWDKKTLVCVTCFLKVVYTVTEFGIQPLDYFELALVPNGLLLFEGPKYYKRPGLFIPGKDDKTKAVEDRRTRVRLDPLSSIDKWRTVKVTRHGKTWKAVQR